MNGFGTIVAMACLLLAQVFFSHPFVHQPGTFNCYNSLGTYLLSAIITKLSGQTLLDYLTPRLFEPLGIEKPTWDADDQGINYGGRDMATRPGSTFPRASGPTAPAGSLSLFSRRKKPSWF